MKFISLLSNIFLLAFLISSSGAQPHARVGKRNLINNDGNEGNDNRQCVHKCTRDLKRGFNSNAVAVCAEAKDVKMGMEPYRACLGGKDNAFTQVCAASCATSDSKAKSLLIKSDAEACKNIGLREKYIWCKLGYNETWEKLSSVVSNIIEEESVEVEESVKVKGLTDTNQQQSDISQAQALLKEVDQAKEEQLKSKDEEPVDGSVDDESVEELADTRDISQNQTLVKEVDQVKEQQLRSKFDFEILGRNNTDDLGSTLQVQELDVRLIHSHETTERKEVSSRMEHSLESHGDGVAEAEAITHFEYFSGNKASTSTSTGTGHCTDFYMTGWMCRCIHGIGIGSDSYHDTVLQLQTHKDIDEVAVKLVGDEGTKYGICAWNIVSSNFTRIRAGISDHMWHYDGGGGDVRGAIILTARSRDISQFIDTGPSGHTPSSKSFKWEVHWIKVCLEDVLLIEFEQSLDLQQIIDELNPWQHLPVRQQVEQQHRVVTEQLGRTLRDWHMISRHMPLTSLSSRAPNITERDTDLNGESESFNSGRFDCTYAPFSSYEVLRLYISVQMLSDHVVFDVDAAPSIIASNQTGGDNYHVQQGVHIRYYCVAVALFLLVLQSYYYYFPLGVRRIIEFETPIATAVYVIILQAFEEILIKLKCWWRHLVDISWVGSKLLANESLRSKSQLNS